MRAQVGRVAIYCRVSTGDQSCERQERDLLAYAERCGYEVAGVWKETVSGARNDRAQRKAVVALARARTIEAILVTELTRWGRSTADLLDSLQDLEAWGVSLIAQTGLQFDLASAQGKLIATLLAALAEFERDLIRERVKSGMAAAKARGVKIGRQPGQYIKGKKLTPAVLQRVREGSSYRRIARDLDLSKNTVLAIMKRAREAEAAV
jgi:putative DNA-invertase from lambdoid prophage Rac